MYVYWCFYLCRQPDLGLYAEERLHASRSYFIYDQETTRTTDDGLGTASVQRYVDIYRLYIQGPGPDVCPPYLWTSIPGRAVQPTIAHPIAAPSVRAGDDLH
jgi:hypothetical protein